MTEYLTILKQKRVESDYIPNVEKLLKKAVDNLTVDEIRIRVAKLSGKILDWVANFMLVEKHSDLFIDFFKKMIEDKNNDIK